MRASTRFKRASHTHVCCQLVCGASAPSSRTAGEPVNPFYVPSRPGTSWYLANSQLSKRQRTSGQFIYDLEYIAPEALLSRSGANSVSALSNRCQLRRRGRERCSCRIWNGNAPTCWALRITSHYHCSQRIDSHEPSAPMTAIRDIIPLAATPAPPSRWQASHLLFRPGECWWRGAAANLAQPLNRFHPGRSRGRLDRLRPEPVTARAREVWEGLLGAPRYKLAELIAREAPESVDGAATRLWTAVECLKKAGIPEGAPLVFDSISAPGWVLLRSGKSRIATFICQVQGLSESLAVGVLTTLPEAASLEQSRLAGPIAGSDGCFAPPSSEPVSVDHSER